MGQPNILQKITKIKILWMNIRAKEVKQICRIMNCLRKFEELLIQQICLCYRHVENKKAGQCSNWRMPKSKSLRIVLTTQNICLQNQCKRKSNLQHKDEINPMNSKIWIRNSAKGMLTVLERIKCSGKLKMTFNKKTTSKPLYSLKHRISLIN